MSATRWKLIDGEPTPTLHDRSHQLTYAGHLGGFANDVVVALALAAEWNAYQSPLVIATKPRPQCMGQAYQCDALVWNGRCLEYVEDHECV